MGSIAKMETMDHIDRYAWWTTWNHQIKPNYLTYKSGQLTPIGRAYLNPGDHFTDCSYAGTRLYATEARVRKRNKNLRYCKSTGTTLIKSLGQGGNVATFNVTAPAAGDYAMHVSFLSVEDRNLTVQVNDGPTHKFLLVASSARGCNKRGTTTVLPLELEGFNAGLNTVTLGDHLPDEQAPLVEWISLVTPDDKTGAVSDLFSFFPND